MKYKVCKCICVWCAITSPFRKLGKWITNSYDKK